MNEILKKLAEASGWSIPEERLNELESIFSGTMDDTQAIRDLDLQWTPPLNVYKAD